MIDYDVLVIGAGSGNMLPHDLAGRRIAIVERDRFGGTCMNRGCIPSKMLAYTADIAQTVRHAARFGVHAELTGADWPAIRDRIFDRTDASAADGLAWRRRSGVDVYTGDARFVAPKVVEVNGEQLRGAQVIVAAGARPQIPDIDGLADVPYETTDTIMRSPTRPESMIILGGGPGAVEMSHVFGAFGTKVTIVERTAKLLSTLDDDIAMRLTELYAARFDLQLLTSVTAVERTARGVAVHTESAAGTGVVEAETLLVAVGRTPNSDQLDVAASGIATDDHGLVVSDETLATNVEGVWAVGDITNRVQLKHLANAEMRVVVHNVFHPDEPRRRGNFHVLPSAIFGDPQIATVGPTERELRADGATFDVARRDYSDTAFGWAAEDTTGFVKVIADPQTRRLLAAHIIGPQAATLIQLIVQAMALGNTVDELAHDVLYAHPAITEVVAQALLALPHAPATRSS